jgi:hypothetical protein
MYMLASLGFRLRQHWQFFMLAFLLKPIFWERNIKTKETTLNAVL